MPDSSPPATEPDQRPARSTLPLIRTLIVDDSAFVRKVVREMLTRSPFIDVVGAARDGEEALRMVEELRPDVVTCDLMMPRLDGEAFVRLQMARRPLPILILSASPQDANQVMSALSAGAVDFVRKPTALATDELLGIRSELVEKVKAAARAPVDTLRAAAAATAAETSVLPAASTATGRAKVDAVVIGVSTGGPQALRRLLPKLPADLPVPVAIVLHMPVGYTAPFAQKLGEVCVLKVTEARDGEPFRPGMAVLAQAGRHLTIERNAAGLLVTRLMVQPIDKLHRPSVDVLFQSASVALGHRVLGVVMTGMGEDGREGAAWLKAQGGTVLTESQDSCVIYGMPRSVDEAGLSDARVHLDCLAETILTYL